MWIDCGKQLSNIEFVKGNIKDSGQCNVIMSSRDLMKSIVSWYHMDCRFDISFLKE